ncbi:MAG: hypothetical protein M0C28_40770 [Candidatus Moduliflexus flocculans]|nr:hypothetical protein [Candidatus Moduliflexus flocculans]
MTPCLAPPGRRPGGEDSALVDGLFQQIARLPARACLVGVLAGAAPRWRCWRSGSCAGGASAARLRRLAGRSGGAGGGRAAGGPATSRGRAGGAPGRPRPPWPRRLPAGHGAAARGGPGGPRGLHRPARSRRCRGRSASSPPRSTWRCAAAPEVPELTAALRDAQREADRISRLAARHRPRCAAVGRARSSALAASTWRRWRGTV